MEFLCEGIRLISLIFLFKISLISMRFLLIFLIFSSLLSPVELSFPMSLNTLQSALVNLHLQIAEQSLQFCSGILLQILITTW